jgi:hypothetical protein
VDGMCVTQTAMHSGSSYLPPLGIQPSPDNDMINVVRKQVDDDVQTRCTNP